MLTYLYKTAYQPVCHFVVSMKHQQHGGVSRDIACLTINLRTLGSQDGAICRVIADLGWFHKEG